MKPDTLTIQLNKVLTEISRREPIVNDKEYRILGVRWYANGLFIKDIKKGSEILANYVYKVEKGDLVYSRLFAWKGSFAIATDEFDGCYVSNEFPCFYVDETQLDPHYLMWYFNQPRIWDNCLEKSEGSTSISRNRFKVGSFLDINIPFHTLKEQNDIVERLQFSSEKNVEINDLRENSKKRISSLRQSILQEAVQGKLVLQDPSDETASVLLEKIKAEKEQLVKEKKIKKEKLEIKEDEVPYDLPQGWAWVRLGNICYFQKGFAFKSLDYKSYGVKIARVSNLNNITSNDFVYIDVESKKLYVQYELLIDDIVLTTVGSWPSSPASVVGNAIFIGADYDGSLLNQNAVRLRAYRLINRKYLFYVLKSDIFKKYIMAVAQGTANQASITQDSIKAFLVGIPPINEQNRIVRKVNYLMDLCDGLEKIVNQSKQESEMLMQAVLQEAFQSVKCANHNS